MITFINTWIINNKELAECLYYWAGLIGIPAAAITFIVAKWHEKKDRENETHAITNDRYVSYLTLCLEHPELDAFDIPKDDPALKKCGVPYQTLILFTIVTSMLENAYLRYQQRRTNKTRIEWQGWEDYMKDWAQRESFRQAWTVIGPQFSVKFVAAMTQLMEQVSIDNSQHNIVTHHKSANSKKALQNHMKQQTSEHAPVLRTWLLGISLFLTASALVFAGFQTMFLRRSVTEQTIQTKLSRNAVTAQTWQGLTQKGSEISKVFIDYPHLRPYFYESKPISTNDANYNAVMSVAELYLDFIDSLADDYVYDLPGMEPNGKYRVLWDRYFKDTFASSPALCACAKEKQSWYSSDEFNEYFPTDTKDLQEKISNVTLKATNPSPAKP